MTNNKTLTARDVINGGPERFDPMSVDTSEIRNLSLTVPKDGNIDINNAEVLATKFLRGADMCGELLAIATAHASRMKDAKQRAYNHAFVVKSQDNKNLKTDKMRTAYAELDEDYQNACDKYNEAVAFVKWIESKYSSFTRFHYLCKKVLERAYPHEKASYWNYNDEELYNEGW